MSKPKLYGVFIALDLYSNPDYNLSGCKSDIKAYKEMLSECYANDLDIDFTNNTIELTDEIATYKNVVDAFSNSKFDNITNQDVFLMIYSGHGSREKQASEFDFISPEGKSETLVLHDSREKGGQDLADKEIAVLLNGIGMKTENITVIFDCCHSGSGTREINDIVLGKSRQLEEDETNYLVRNSYSKDGQRRYESYLNGYFKSNFDSKPEVPFTKHILLAACDEKEKARELKNPSIGAFTKSLIEVIKQDPNQDYVSMFNITRSLMSKNNITQNPRLNSHLFFNSFSSFLLNKPKESRLFNLLNDNGQWEVNLGAIQGMPTDRDVYFEIFLDNDKKASGKVKDIFTNKSTLELVDNIDASSTEYKAKLISPLSPPLLIKNMSDGEGNNRLSKALENYNPINFKFERNANGAHYGVKCSSDRVSLLQLDRNEEIIAYVGDNEDEIFQLLFDDLEDIGTWESKLNIKNKKLRFNPKEVEFTFKDLTNNKEYRNEGIVNLNIAKDEDGDFTISYALSIKNNTPKEIKCSLLYFSKKYSVESWINNLAVPPGKEFDFEIPDEDYRYLGFNETDNGFTKDIFKVFISTGDFVEVETLLQDGLPLINRVNENNEIVCNLGEEKGSLRSIVGSKKYKNQWFTKEIEINSSKKELAFGTRNIEVNENVTIQAPESLKGQINLKTVTSNTRSLDEDQIVAQLVKLDADFELISLENTRSFFGTPNCIEFNDLENLDALNDEPLKIIMKADGEELVMPITFDGEHFLPLDIKAPDNGEYNFEIRSLPKEQNKKSLKQAIRLFFIKIRKGSKDNAQILRYIDSKTGERIEDLKELKKLVLNSDKTLLMIHGIIGNTKEMASVGKSLLDEKKYDLVMTYDYENLNTDIETTAFNLYESLTEDLGFNGNKKITILAHSMGGLVSRAMIEKLDGARLVDKLVLAGTPSLGSKFAEVGGGIAKYLSVVFYLINVAMDLKQIKLIFDLASGRLKVDKTLNQMTLDDPEKWLKKLNVSKDPNIPYHLFHGNLDSYLANNANSNKLLKKMYKLGGKLFYPSPQKSDLIVSEQSMLGVPKNRVPSATHKELASIHMTYFSDSDSIEDIKKVL